MFDGELRGSGVGGGSAKRGVFVGIGAVLLGDGTVVGCGCCDGVLGCFGLERLGIESYRSGQWVEPRG
jgi:hypothetical protein